MNTTYDSAVFYGSKPVGVDMGKFYVVGTWAHKFGENHSVGISPMISWQRFKAYGLEQFSGFSSDATKLTGNGYATSFGFGGRIGYMGNWTPWLTVGASYQTEVAYGKLKEYAGLFAEHGYFDDPANWTVGIAVHPTSKVTVAVDVQQIYYSKEASVGNPMLPNLMQAPLGADKAFALPLRIGVFEADRGLSVAMANPVSLLRTLNAGNAMDVAAQKVVDDVAAALAPVGPVAQKAAGQLRDSGELGGMGGGPFPDKVVPVVTPARSPAEVAKALQGGIADSAGWWALYAYKASEDVWVVGVTNAKTEGRAFGIGGEKRATKATPYPGLDHAPAFPVEVVVTKKGSGSSVQILKEMWRMKLYFEDAGNWAFMKNMGMPGDIQAEIEAAVRKAIP